MTEMKQGLKALRIESSGGPDGLSARLLNHLIKLVCNLNLGAMNEILTVSEKIYKLSKRFFIFINKVN